MLSTALISVRNREPQNDFKTVPLDDDQELPVPPEFPDDFKGKVRTHTDLVSLIGETSTLTPKAGGREYVTLCPFHDDHKPSLTISPERQSFRCWVCDEGGDCFTWVMLIDSVGFPEALEILARRARLEMPKGRRGSGNGQQTTDWYDSLTWAENEFHQCLLTASAAQPARDYLEDRGFSTETIARFRIGYHPNDWKWLQGRAQGRFLLSQLFSVRLLGQKDAHSGYYDNFVDRLLFPIRDTQARAVAFGGRILPGNPNPDLPKYWNSPESPVFSKHKVLYGLDVARAAIKDTNTAVVVEGYTDCIIANQHGISNVVGTLGTALSELHVKSLKRLARKVVLIYDGDKAGQNAAERALVKFLAEDVDLRILTLPNEMDPADFLAARGVTELRTMIEQAPEAWEFKLAAEIARYGLENLDAQRRVLDSMLELVSGASRLAGTIGEDILLQKLSQKTGVSEQAVRSRMAQIRRTKSTGNNAAVKSSQKFGTKQKFDSTHSPPTRPPKDDKLERELIAVIFTRPTLVDTIRKEIRDDDLRHSELRQLVKTCFDIHAQGREPNVDVVMTTLEDPKLKKWAKTIDDQARDQEVESKLADSSADDASIPDYLQTILHNFESRRQEASRDQLKGEMAQQSKSPNGLDEKWKTLLQQFTELQRKRANKKPFS